MAEATLCKIDDCSKPARKRGMCHMHYERVRKYSDPNVARRYPERGSVLRYLLDHMHDECPKWPFAKNKHGYGKLQYKGSVRAAHRVVCEIVHGPPPSPLHDAAHNCGRGNEGCFGASCLEWKTKAENQADRVRHGTSNRGAAHGLAKLTPSEVQAIRLMAKTATHNEVAAKFNIARVTVSDIVSGRRWGWLESKVHL